MTVHATGIPATGGTKHLPRLPTSTHAALIEAGTWLRTPYHHRARIKSVGVDCATLLCEVYHRAGLIDYVELPFYPPDWHMHRSRELYCEIVERYADPFEGPPDPADIVVFKFGRCYSHGMIVVQWPLCIHAYINEPVGYVDVNKDHRFLQREHKFYRLRTK